MLSSKYANNSIVTDAAKKLISEILAESKKSKKKHGDAELKSIIADTHALLKGTLLDHERDAYLETASEWNKSHQSTFKKIIGDCLIALAVALIATAIFTVPILSLAIAGAMALSSAVSMALSGGVIGTTAVASAVCGGLFFRKASVTKQMEILEHQAPEMEIAEISGNDAGEVIAATI